jgi:hypothetical protein
MLDGGQQWPQHEFAAVVRRIVGQSLGVHETPDNSRSIRLRRVRPRTDRVAGLGATS